MCARQLLDQAEILFPNFRALTRNRFETERVKWKVNRVTYPTYDNIDLYFSLFLPFSFELRRHMLLITDIERALGAWVGSFLRMLYYASVGDGKLTV